MVKSLYIKFALIAFLWALGATDVMAYGNNDETYFERESEHFIVHYPASREAFAIRAMAVAEEAHARLTPMLKWVPQEKTHIAVQTEIDDANGWARVVPENEIHLYAWTPEADEELGNYDDWMRLLIYHEYTHVLHMDVNDNGFYTFLNAIFGKFARENATLPRWFTEGLAVYSETKMSTGGRLRSPLYRTMLRNAALGQKLPTLGGMSAGSVDWPGGTESYLFGSFFLAWLAENYGEHNIIRFIQAYSRQVVPYAMNRVAVRVYGKTWDKLWDEWRRFEIKKAHAQKYKFSELESETVPEILVLPHRHGQPKARPGANSFVYQKNDGAHKLELTLYDVESESETGLVECSGRCNSAWSEDAQTLYFVHSEVRDGYSQRSTLYAYDMADKSVKRLTDDVHVRSVAVSHSSLYLIAQVNESARLLRMPLEALKEDMNLAEFECIYAGQPMEQLDEIAVFGAASADDDFVAVTRFDPVAAQHDIVWSQAKTLVDQGIWNEVTASALLDTSPEWADSGDEIRFVSEDGFGVLQRYAYSLADGSVTRTTHVLSGVTNPTTLANGDVVFTMYTANGKAIARLAKDGLVAKDETSEFAKRERRGGVETLAVVPNEKRDYKPWRWLFPLQWTPNFSTDFRDFVVGLSFSGNDYLDLHSYSVKVDYKSRVDAFDFSFNYLYARWLWNIGVSASYANETGYWFDGLKNAEYEYQQSTASIYATRYVGGRDFRQVFYIGFNVQHAQSSDRLSWSMRDPAGKPPGLPSLGWRNSVVAKYTLSNMKAYEKAVSKSDGMSLSMNMRFEAPWLGAEYYLFLANVDAQFYWTMPYAETHAIGLELAAGGSYTQNPNRTPFSLSATTTTSLSSVLSQTGSDAAIHGYMASAFVGNHYLYAHAEYNFGIWDPQLGLSTLPLGLQRISMSVFGDWGYTWKAGEFDIMRSTPAIGAQLHVDLNLGYRLVQRVTLGYAYGEYHQVFFGLF